MLHCHTGAVELVIGCLDRGSSIGEGFQFTRRILSARSGGFNLLARTTSRVLLTDSVFFLSISVSWPFLAESACLAQYTCGIRYRGSRGLCPLAGLASLVGNTDISF
mgnify:CR=1 FL=1